MSSVQHQSIGCWNIYMDTFSKETDQRPQHNHYTNGSVTTLDGAGHGHHRDFHGEVQTIQLVKEGGLGLSIVAAKGGLTPSLGIFVK